MPMPTPSQAASNWANGMRNGVEKAKQGVNNVTISPTMKAAQAVDRQVAGVQRAASEGRTQAALQAVTLQQWKDAYNTKAPARMQAGATIGQPKMEKFMTQWLPFEKSVVESLPPRGSLDDNINRAMELMRRNSNFNYQKIG